MNPWVIGVDLGGTKIEVGLVSPENQIVGRRRIPTHPELGPASVVERIAGCVKELEALLPPGERAAALGICSPGPVDFESGMLVDPPNLNGMHNAPLRQMLQERLNLPVSLEHDAKATALGEFYYGAGRGEQSMVYIIVGTGVGAAIIEDGRVLRGKHNTAGEIGHVTLDQNGELCSCGCYGCVETFMSGPWLARRYQKALAASSQPEPDAPILGETVSSLAEKGDPLATRIMNEAGQALGVAIGAMAMLLNIDLFVVGGSVAKAGDLFLEPARRELPHHAYRSVGCGVQLLATELGDDGPILGCAWMARDALRQALPPAASVGALAAPKSERELLEQVEGTIFDIQRFSVHDGPGIRTSVFFKGCTLRCGWCSNPESQRPHPELGLSAARCVRCGQFVEACPEIWEHGAETLAARQQFGERADLCPVQGIHWLGRRVTAAEIIAEALNDAPFYGNGGGLTLAGGEPTFQPRLAEAVLRLARLEGLSTAIETAGHTHWKVWDRLLPHLDHILFDLKHLDPAVHRAHTGVDNVLILANLRKLLEMRAPVEIRLPLIPGFNASPEHIEAVAAFLAPWQANLPALRLLPFHQYGRSKYAALRRPYAWENVEPLADEIVESFVQQLNARGFQVAIGG